MDDSAAAKREFWRGTIELAILSLIDSGPRYGYELLTSLSRTANDSVEIKEGTLYPVLHRLEDGGYIRGSWEAEGRGVPRKYYQLTAAGRARLEMLRGEWERLAERMRALLEGGGSG